MKACLTVDLDGVITREHPTGEYPRGTVIEHPDAWRLVLRGCADPGDEECRRRVARAASPAEIEAARRAYPRVAAGIHPDDYEAFDRGEIVGYYPDGSPIPGPNAMDEDTPDEETDDDGGLCTSYDCYS